MKFMSALLLSLGLHFLLLLVLQLLQNHTPPTNQSVIIDFAPISEKENVRQVVRSSLVPDKYKVESTEDKLKFLSEKFQRVKQQTRAALSGLTKNRGQDDTHQPSRDMQAPKSKSIDALAPKYNFKPRQVRNNQDFGESTISDSISKEVPIGRMTALNTDQYLFYSFYERVSDLVYIRWRNLVIHAQDNLVASKINYNSNNTWTTQIEIRLKLNGEYISGHVMKPSGIPMFDQAAILAFKQAGLFPNPPREMVDPDGNIIRLKYSLQVYFDPKVLVQK